MNMLTDIIDREVIRYEEAVRRAHSYIKNMHPDFSGSFDDMVEDFYGMILANEDMA
jgi:hypothetical protein